MYFKITVIIPRTHRGFQGLRIHLFSLNPVEYKSETLLTFEAGNWVSVVIGAPLHTQQGLSQNQNPEGPL